MEHRGLMVLLLATLATGGTPACGEESPPGVRTEGAPAEAKDAARAPDGAVDGAWERGKRRLPPAAAQQREERESMVREQIALPTDGRQPVRSEAVLDAMRAVPRHVFVPEAYRDEAYGDYPIPIGHGQTISQPYIVAWMTELLELTPRSRVLEVGTGSGYQAAVLAHLTPHVTTVEIVEDLARRARKTLDAQGYTEVQCLHGDGYGGWPEKAPFDAIIVTCAPEKLPAPLWEQLAPGGRIVIPVGRRDQIQKLVIVTKSEDGKRRDREVTLVRFVPLTRDQSLKGTTLEPGTTAEGTKGR